MNRYCISARALVFLLPLAGCSSVAPTLTSTTTTTTATVPATIANLQSYNDPTGTLSTYTSAGVIDLSSHFFQPLGTNGRTCATCHQLSQGISINANSVQALFTSSAGADALFAAIDGANYPTAPAGDATSRSLLLNNGLIRIPVTVPTTAQFTIAAIHDPYGCAITTSATGQKIVSVYRRPLTLSTLPMLSAVMWDTRETLAPLTSSSTLSASLTSDLTQQFLDAVSTHMQGATAPSAATLTELLAFSQSLSVAQATDTQAGSLSAAGAQGGAANLAATLYYPGNNDSFGGDPTGKAFDPNVFTLYNAWRNATNPQQASINRGQGVFNTAPMQITNVRGINDNAALGSPNNLRGSCTTCHDTPNVGSHSLPLPLDTTTSRIAANETDAAILAGLAQLTAPDLPVFQITGCRDAANRPVTYTTTDPGKALSTGLCADVNRMKVPSLRGLAARAPYFHGGTAKNLQQVVAFYNARFQMNLSPAQQTDLVNFLNAL